MHVREFVYPRIACYRPGMCPLGLSGSQNDQGRIEPVMSSALFEPRGGLGSRERETNEGAHSISRLILCRKTLRQACR